MIKTKDKRVFELDLYDYYPQLINYKPFSIEYVDFCYKLSDKDIIIPPIVICKKERCIGEPDSIDKFCNEIVVFIERIIKDDNLKCPFITFPYTKQSLTDLVSFICDNIFRVYIDYSYDKYGALSLNIKEIASVIVCKRYIKKVL